MALGVVLELAEDEGRDFRRGKGLPAELDAEDLARRQIAGQAEGKEFEFLLHVLDATAH